MRNPNRKTAIICVAVCSALAGCAADTERFPSLALRDAERVSGSFEPTQGEAIRPSPLAADTLASVAEITARAGSAHQDFLSSTPMASSLIEAASGTDSESNSWAAAQIALADLDAKRGATGTALADLDQFYADASLRFEERQQVAEARSEVAQLVAIQDDQLDKLRAELPR